MNIRTVRRVRGSHSGPSEQVTKAPSVDTSPFARHMEGPKTSGQSGLKLHGGGTMTILSSTISQDEGKNGWYTLISLAVAFSLFVHTKCCSAAAEACSREANKKNCVDA